MKNIVFLLLVFLFTNCSNSQQISKTGNGISFKVCDVELAQNLLPEQSAKNVMENLVKNKEEVLYGGSKDGLLPSPELLCSSLAEGNLIPSQANPFAEAVYTAYAQHRPLVISPDMVWLLVTQGFARHVKENAEDLRDIFVDHEGQVNLDIRRASYQPQSKVFWEGIFPDFSASIAANTKEEVWGFVAPKFSTTTLVEKAAFEITLMDAMSPYFQYSISIVCGIPEITLEGQPEDWDKIEKQIEQLNNYGMDWWTDDLKNIVQEFKKASRGEVNQKFWKNIFLEQSYSVGCGSAQFMTGWMLDFFPYLKSGQDKDGNVKYIKNPVLTGTEGASRKEKNYDAARIKMENIPGGFSRAKVLLNNNGAMTTLNFNAGFVGMTQDEKTLALRPNIQWFVTDLHLPPTEEELEKYHKGVK